MNFSSRSPAVWMLGAGILGFVTAAVFSGVLHWSRAEFVAIWLMAGLVFLTAYTRAVRLDWWTQFRRRWRSGLVGGVLLGVLLARTVMAQPGSPGPEGTGMFWAIAWYGVLYGVVDALLLNILPVLEVYRARPQVGGRQGQYRVRIAMTALAASLLITAMYHVGFVEFRGPALVRPLVGNGLITAGYLLSGNPLTPLVGHIVMHVTAAVHGLETTFQLPPHY
jgi:hypothetical protein